MLPPTQLKDQNQELAKLVFKEMMSNTSDQTKSIISHQVWYKDIEKEPELITTNLLALLSETQQLLNRHGYHCHRDRWFAETHYYRSTGQKLESPLAWHQDNNGGWPEKEVVTAIYYLKKDKEILGGNLLYSLENRDPDHWTGDFHPLGSILPTHMWGWPKQTPTPKPKYPSVKVETGLTVLMRGDMWHRPEEMSGTGERKLLVIQLPRKVEC